MDTQEFAYTLKLKGLDCANCAAELEREIAKIEGIQKVQVSFMNQKCQYDCEASLQKSLEEKIIAIFHEEEPDVEILLDSQASSKKEKTFPYVLRLEGLDCANCAAKMEEQIKKEPLVFDAQVSFMNQKCSFDCAKQDYDQVVARIKELFHQEEPEVVFLENKEEKVGEKKEEDDHRNWIRLAIGALIMVVGFILKNTTGQAIAPIVFLAAYFLLGYDVLLQAGRNILHGKVFDENFLMALASVGAILLGDMGEAVAVMLFYQVGEAFQDRAVENSRKSIADLMDIRPDYAREVRGEETVMVSPESVEVGTIIEVNPGERLPLDGKIVKGVSSLDTSSLTGESLPREVKVGDEVFSGSVNQSGVLQIEVSKPYGESTVARILDLVENASEHKAPSENFITKFARVYTPTVVLGAVGLVILLPLLTNISLHDALYRACTFLVISCPCALVISIPLSFFAGIGGLSKKGILAKGANVLEELSSVTQAVFDKTGTLTKGVFAVTNIEGDSQVLELAAYAENHSTHPIGKSILAAYGKEVQEDRIQDLQEVSGQGIVLKVDGKETYVGNQVLMASHGIQVPEASPVGTLVYVAQAGKLLGTITIADTEKKTSQAAIQELQHLGLQRTIMVTGDRKVAADAMAKKLGITEVRAECLPEDKVKAVQAIKEQGKTLFAGDGINDAPVLSMADVGVAMGGLGSDAAIEAADLVIMDDDPEKIAVAYQGAKATKRIVTQNIVFALGVKITVLLLGAFGIANMWLAIFADVGVSVLCILNSIRLLYK